MACGTVILISVMAFIALKIDRRRLRKKYENLVALYNEKKIVNQHSIDLEEVGTEIYDTTNSILLDNTTITSINNKEIATILEQRISTMADVTLQKLLLKLEKFEKCNRYLKPDTSLASLANYIGTNQTYLSELLKTHRGVTYSNYINKLRIQYITQKLFVNPKYQQYKITHLAYECGFASRQVFISAFKKVTGMTPSYYISQLKSDEKKEIV